MAVAANFAPTLRELSRRVLRPAGIEVRISTGSSGQLFAQIVQGAPFEVFFSADAARPRELEERGEGVAGTRFTYARGVLVLSRASRSDARHLAIANPKTAPYGQAAREALTALGLWSSLESHIVRAESAAQVLQHVTSGSAALGFVALAQVRALPEAQRGSMWLVPAALYAPIDQQVILLQRGAAHPAARELLELVRSSAARAILVAQGYELIEEARVGEH